MAAVVDEIELVGGGIPVPENLVDLDQSSVDMPPPPMMAPLKQLKRLFGESVLPLISYAPFNESCSRFRSSAGSRHGENRTVDYTTGTKPGEYRIAREVSAGRQFDVWENARLFALVNLAMADGYIAGSKTNTITTTGGQSLPFTSVAIAHG